MRTFADSLRPLFVELPSFFRLHIKQVLVILNIRWLLFFPLSTVLASILRTALVVLPLSPAVSPAGLVVSVVFVYVSVTLLFSSFALMFLSVSLVRSLLDVGLPSRHHHQSALPPSSVNCPPLKIKLWSAACRQERAALSQLSFSFFLFFF